jgi:hypothetical protein
MYYGFHSMKALQTVETTKKQVIKACASESLFQDLGYLLSQYLQRNHIFIVGGRNETACLPHGKYYDPNQYSSKAIVPLNHLRHSHAAVELMETVYVLGVMMLEKMSGCIMFFDVSKPDLLPLPQLPAQAKPVQTAAWDDLL